MSNVQGPPLQPNTKVQPNAKMQPSRHEPVLSRFEFWPAWMMYTPVVAQWLWLSVRYRSLTLPFLANPKLTLAGMVGVSKSELMQQATGACAQAILPWVRHVIDQRTPDLQAQHCVQQAEALNIVFPFVCKPDIGCRGAGVKLVHTVEQLREILRQYPLGAGLLCQKLADFEPEVGIFFVRHSAARSGEIVGMTHKFSPVVVGDGLRTLGELVSAEPRAGQLLHLYQSRHAARWEQSIPAGEKVKLVFSASHCRGAEFRDAKEHITPALTAAVNAIMDGLPEFHYGRMDVKYADLDQLRAGKTLQIVEINGASAESLHIWDRNARLMDAWRTLMWQYRTLFALGDKQRARGFSTPGLAKLLRHWQLERELTKHYPPTD